METMVNYAQQFIKIKLVFHSLTGDPQFLFHFWNK